MSRTGPILRRAGRWSLLALGVGVALGFGLGSLGLLPVADVDIRWTVPALSVSEYVPEALSTEGEETALVYVGSSTCGWSNTPELPSLIKGLKAELQSRARREGWRFASIGIVGTGVMIMMAMEGVSTTVRSTEPPAKMVRRSRKMSTARNRSCPSANTAPT